MTHAEYPKVVYTATGQARLLPDASAARQLPDGPWYEDPEGRVPVAPGPEPEPEPVEAPAEPAPAKPRSHKKAAKD